MADVALQSVLRQLRRLAAPKGVAALTDTQLLRRVVEACDEAAFEVLVWRQGRWSSAHAANCSATRKTPRTLSRPRS